jgi:hypothetical protein
MKGLKAMGLGFDSIFVGAQRRCARVGKISKELIHE